MQLLHSIALLAHTGSLLHRTDPELIRELAAAVGECVEPHARRLQTSASAFLFGVPLLPHQPARKPVVDRKANNCTPKPDRDFGDWDRNGMGLLTEPTAQHALPSTAEGDSGWAVRPTGHSVPACSPAGQELATPVQGTV